MENNLDLLKDYEYDDIDDAVEFEELRGKFLVSVDLIKGEYTTPADKILFTFSDGTAYLMAHSQECCEMVYIEDIDAPITDLVGGKIILAEESVSSARDDHDDVYGIMLWTFYKLSTNKASCTIRWIGSSNGYYGVSVELFKLHKIERRNTWTPYKH